MSEITRMTALELGREIKKGTATPVQAALEVIETIKQQDNLYHAVLTLAEEEALCQAQQVQEQLQRGELDSPLAGVPILIKDNICTKGIRTTCASRILGEFDPPYDATVIERLKAAGMVIIGKTNMDEFAMGSTTETSYHGPTKNPVDPSRVPGGSSGGSAAAVAAEEIPCALGSDTGGSIRQPASYCGVIGFKPTYGTVSRFGLIAYASSLDQIGPLARDVRDCAALMDLIKGKDPMDGTSLDLNLGPDLNRGSYLDHLDGSVEGMRIALPKECFDDGLDPEIRDSILEAAKVFQHCGAEIKETEMPFLHYAVPAYYIMATAEASSNLSRFDGVKYGFRSDHYEDLTEMYEATRSEGFGDEVKKRILLGTFVLSSGYYDAYYRKALQVKALIKDGFDQIFRETDLLLMPVAPTVAPKLGESLKDPLKMYLSDIYTVSINIAGLPGLSVPCGVNSQGLPIGMQLVGPRLGDFKVLNAGFAYQMAGKEEQ